MSTTLTHSDTVSGTTILDDGTKVYWTEGRSSIVVIIHPDGRREEVAASRPHPILDHPAVSEGAADEMRTMTAEEEVEHAAARA